MKKPVFVNERIYHIYNRGVEKRTIFIDDADRFRFIHDLFEFNDILPASNVQYHFTKLLEVEPPIVHKPRKLLVEVLAFCLMPNHYHLIARQRAQNGLVNFMQKMGTGYTMYFNQKYDRVGPLFQGRFKAVALDNESQLTYLPFYVHLNPLDLALPTWKEREIKDYQKAMRFLEKYRWSSFLDYIGKKNFPSVTSRNFFLEFFGGSENYQKETLQYLKHLDLEIIGDILLE